MRKVFVVAGMPSTIPYDATCDYVGVDQGALFCMEQGIPLVFAIGDFDSISPEKESKLKSYTTVYPFDTHKDFTDTELALHKVEEYGYKEIVLLGALGGRIDHELANISLLVHSGIPFVIENEQNKMFVLEEGVHHIQKERRYFSLIPLMDSLISIEGCAYPLDHKDIPKELLLTISNEIVEKEAIVHVHKGRMLAIHSQDAT